MAGTIVHLLIAEKLLEALRQGIFCTEHTDKILENPDLFIAGNICPDGIMARKDYERSMKLHTHFRDGIPDGTFGNPGTIDLFEKRMQTFWKQHRADEKENPGLYLGYITHMMTHERFILTERPRFFEQIASIGLTKKDKKTFEIFNEETDLVDFRLLCEYPVLKEAQISLERVKPYEIKGMITQEELTESRRWILSHFFETEHEKKEAIFLQYDSMKQFIENVIKEIPDRLKQL